MASSDSDNKPDHIEQPEPAKKSKAKPRSRKAKAKPKKAANNEEKPDLKPTEASEGASGREAETKPEEASSPPAAEKPAKKKAKPRGRKSKAKPKADEAAQAAAAAAEPAKPAAEKTEPATPTPEAGAADQVESQDKEQLSSGPQESVPAADSTTPPAEGKKRPKAKRRGRPKKNKPAQEPAKLETPQPATPEELAAKEAVEEYEVAEPETAEPAADEADVAVTPPPAPPVPKRQPPLIIIASGNPAKIKAVELAFSRMFPDEKFDYEGISVESGVSDQPMSDDETFAGALMRAQTCRETRPEATYWVGLEGGLEEIGDELHAFAWMVIYGPDELMGKSRTATFVLPPAVAELILVEGKELGEADDLVFGKTNSKQSSGAVGILTHGLIDRANYYAEALVLALVPFKNPQLYKVEQEEAIEA